MLQKFAIIASLAAIASAWHQQQAYAPRPVHGKRQFHGSQKQVHAPVRAKKEQPRLARAHYGQKVLSHVPVRAATHQFDRDYRVDGYHTDRDQKKLASGKSFQSFKHPGTTTQSKCDTNVRIVFNWCITKVAHMEFGSFLWNIWNIWNICCLETIKIK